MQNLCAFSSDHPDIDGIWSNKLHHWIPWPLKPISTYLNCSKSLRNHETTAIDGNFLIWRLLFHLWHINHWSNCFAFCAVLTQLDPSKMPESFSLEKFWGLPKWQEETPKRQNRLDFSWIGALPPMICGVTLGEPFESEYLLIYGEFSGIYWPSPQAGPPSGPLLQLGRAD